MLHPTAALRAQFDMQTRLFANVLSGISDAEANIRNTDTTNNIKWVAGHLLHTRINSLSRTVGLPFDNGYAAAFDRGVALDVNAEYPSLEVILDRWNSTAPAIAEALAGLGEDTLAATAPSPAPIADPTLLGLLAFLLSHESLHIGQLSILRKMAGKEAMSFR